MRSWTHYRCVIPYTHPKLSVLAQVILSVMFFDVETSPSPQRLVPVVCRILCKIKKSAHFTPIIYSIVFKLAQYMKFLLRYTVSSTLQLHYVLINSCTILGSYLKHFTRQSVTQRNLLSVWPGVVISQFMMCLTRRYSMRYNYSCR